MVSGFCSDSTMDSVLVQHSCSSLVVYHVRIHFFLKRIQFGHNYSNTGGFCQVNDPCELYPYFSSTTGTSLCPSSTEILQSSCPNPEVSLHLRCACFPLQLSQGIHGGQGMLDDSLGVQSGRILGGGVSRWGCKIGFFGVVLKMICKELVYRKDVQKGRILATKHWRIKVDRRNGLGER